MDNPYVRLQIIGGTSLCYFGMRVYQIIALHNSPGPLRILAIINRSPWRCQRSLANLQNGNAVTVDGVSSWVIMAEMGCKFSFVGSFPSLL